MGFSIPGTGALDKAVNWTKDHVADAADQVADVAQKGSKVVTSTASRGTEGLRDLVGPVTHPIATARATVDRVRDKASDVVGGARDRVAGAADRVRDKASDVVGGVRDRVAHAADRVRDKATDVVGGARDRVAGAAGRVRDAAGEVLDGAAGVVDKAGDVASDAWDVASTVVTPGGFDRKVHELTSPVDDLGPGDSVSFDAGGEVNAAVSVSGGAAVEVTRNDDGTYTIRGNVDGAVGGKISDSGLDFGAGAGVEFTADNATDARQIADTLVKTGIANAPSLTPTGPLTAPVTNFLYGPSKEELKQLGDHLTAVEISGNAGAGLGARLGLTPDLDESAQGSVQGDVTLRLEIADGRPTAATLRSTFQASGDADAGVVTSAGTGLPLGGLLPNEAVDKVKKSTGVDLRDGLSGGDATVSITVEHSVNLKSTGLDTPGWKELTVLGGQSLPGIVPDGEPTSKVTVSADATAEAGRGIHAEATLDGLNPSDAVNVARGLAKGDVGAALRSTDAKVDYEVHGTHVKNEGIDADFIVGGVHATRTTIDAGEPIVEGSIPIGGAGKAGASAADRVNVVSLEDARGVPYDPDFRSTPDAIVNPRNPADRVGPPIAFEQHVGAEVARSLGLEGQVRDLSRSHGTRVPAERNTVTPQLLHEPKINISGEGSGKKGAGGADDLSVRPDWVVVQKDNSVLAVEATLDGNFTIKNEGSNYAHKELQIQGSIDALVNTFGQDRPIHYVIRSPAEPGPRAENALKDVERLLSDPKYANVTVTWVAG